MLVASWTLLLPEAIAGKGILLIHIPFSPFSFLLWNSLGSVILPSQGSEFHTGLLSVGGDPTLIPP